MNLIKFFTIDKGFYVIDKIAYFTKISIGEMFLNLQEQFGIFKGIKLKRVNK